MNDLKETLKHYSKFFELKTRNRQFIVLSEDAPDELKEFVSEVHHSGEFGGCLPNDWVYSIIEEAFEDIQGYEYPESAVDEIECAAYYSCLNRWIGEPFAPSYCDDVLEGWYPKRFYDLVGAAQVRAKSDIYKLVIEFCEENIKEEEK